MVLTKKQKPAKRITGPTGPTLADLAYNRGREEGYQHGRDEGYRQGRQIAAAQAAAAMAKAAASTTASPPAAEPKPHTFDVLVITAGLITSLEIGVIQPFKELRQKSKFQYEVRVEEDVSKELIASASIVVFVRNVEPSSYKYLEWAHELGKKTVYVIDDNFLELKENTPVGQYYADAQRRETFIRFLRHSTLIKVDAPDLGDYIRSQFNRNVVYFPASVDFDWLDQDEQRKRENDQLVIGYEGGAKEEDFAPVIPALQRILEYYGGFVRLEFFGYVPPALADHPSVSYKGGEMEYKPFLRKLNQANWDIGLAPLADTPFNKGKTNNKYREYAACRIPGLYSNSPVYSHWVVPGETGVLVPHTEEGWFTHIKDLIENPPLRQHIKEQAEAAARQHFSVQACVDNWKSYILKM